ncbi:hypothetical protein L486_02643 [Kwoniella mangroviensis CBS 10435]|uniref:Uncharacterized protein n=1 Tax=Kwoniella mangroviensis CBS 10435 TaxID=1331196 RepID=A0A1B9IWQ4_9TREE|nr:hypothetical protein L486_02643 [Kwoniella mangroviensis CBS 10435]
MNSEILDLENQGFVNELPPHITSEEEASMIPQLPAYSEGYQMEHSLHSQANSGPDELNSMTPIGPFAPAAAGGGVNPYQQHADVKIDSTGYEDVSDPEALAYSYSVPSDPLPPSSYIDTQHIPPVGYIKKHFEPAQHLQSYKPANIKQYKTKPQTQIVTQSTESKSQVAESMQMMMMNQMMMQQMQAQQMQVAQMAAINQQNMHMQSQMMQPGVQGNKKKDKPCKQSKGSINIQNCAQKVKQKPHKNRSKFVLTSNLVNHLPLPPIAIQQPSIETVALDNWQEATIILCFAAVGLIYLICSRAGGEEKKEDVASKHMS